MKLSVWVLMLGSIATTLSWGGLVPTEMEGWVIQVGENAIPSERYAAEEFRRLFKEVVELDLPVETGAGATSKVVSIAPDQPPQGAEPLPEDEESLGYIVDEDSITIYGNRPRGVLYGVYEFFEKNFGVRFLTADHTEYPEIEKGFEIPLGSHSYTPPFSFRWPYYRENAIHPEFAARMRVNTVADDERVGGKTPQSLINHSFFQWCPVDKYGKDHPEYFALVDGERKLEMGGGGPELCVTKPAVIDIVSDAVIEYLDANPYMKNVSVSQNDNDAYCRCATCEAVNQREGTPMGSNLALVNAVAERVEKKHPETKVGTLAYWYTRKAPKTIEPRDNVQIQLCSIECCTLHPINDPNCKKNKEFCQDVEDWKGICDDIWIWNYNTNFSSYDLPFPNLRVIAPNVRFFRDNNAKGIFMQANGNGTAGEMCELRNYVIAQCLWDPNREGWELVEEFCHAHYGEAAGPILEYLTMLHDNAEAAGVHPTCFPTAGEVGLTPEVAAKALEYFDQALAEVQGDAEKKARVEKASICAYKAQVELAGTRFDEGYLVLDVPPERVGLVDRYLDLCRKHEMTMVSEQKAFEEFAKELEPIRKGIPAVRIDTDLWRMVALPQQNGRIAELTYLPTGKNIVEAKHRIFYRHHAFEDWGLEGYDHVKPATFEGSIANQTLTMKKTLEDGSTLEKSIRLGTKDEPTIFVKTTLTHRGPEKKTYQIKAHPEYDTGTGSDEVEDLSVYEKDEEWTVVNQDWNHDEGPNKEKVDTAKGGAFAFFNHEKGYGVLQTYDPNNYEKPRLWWSAGRRQIDLELISKRVELSPGESYAYEYKVDYLDKPPL